GVEPVTTPMTALGCSTIKSCSIRATSSDACALSGRIFTFTMSVTVRMFSGVKCDGDKALSRLTAVLRTELACSPGPVPRAQRQRHRHVSAITRALAQPKTRGPAARRGRVGHRGPAE